MRWNRVRRGQQAHALHQQPPPSCPNSKVYVCPRYPHHHCNRWCLAEVALLREESSLPAPSPIKARALDASESWMRGPAMVVRYSIMVSPALFSLGNQSSWRVGRPKSSDRSIGSVRHGEMAEGWGGPDGKRGPPSFQQVASWGS